MGPPWHLWGAGGGREPLPSRVEGSMAKVSCVQCTGAWKPEATDTNAKHRNQGACVTQSKRKCKWNRVPFRAGVDEWRCACRCVVQVTRRVGDDEAIRVVRRADSDAPCGYRCAVRVTGQASSCAHILSHPLSAACRPVSPRRAYLSKVEAAQPLPRESSLGRPSGIRAVATPFSCGSMVLVL